MRGAGGMSRVLAVLSGLRGQVAGRRVAPVVMWGTAAGLLAWAVLVPMTSAWSIGWQLESERTSLRSDMAAIEQVSALRGRVLELRARQGSLGAPPVVHVTDLNEVPFSIARVLPEGVSVTEWATRTARTSAVGRIGLLVPDYAAATAAVAALSSARGVLVESLSVSTAQGREAGRGLRVLVEVVPAPRR